MGNHLAYITYNTEPSNTTNRKNTIRRTSKFSEKQKYDRTDLKL